jgi:hypothetical protein
MDAGTTAGTAVAGGGSERFGDEARDGHARQGIPRGADGVLPGHHLELVARADGLDLLIRELEHEDRSPLVLTVELEERPVPHETTSGDGLGVRQLTGLLQTLADGGDQLGLVAVDEAARQLVVVAIADQVEPGRLQHHDLELVAQVVEPVADDERAATAVLVEQPLVPGLAGNLADLELTVIRVREHVVTAVDVLPAGDGVLGIVVEHGLGETGVVHDTSFQWLVLLGGCRGARAVSVLVIPARRRMTTREDPGPPHGVRPVRGVFPRAEQ